MLDLFRAEVEGQGGQLYDSLLALEQGIDSASHLERLMRAAHSIKGAARLVGVDAVVRLAHEMESIFVAAQNAVLSVDGQSVDILLQVLDAIINIAKLSDDEVTHWGEMHATDLDTMLANLHAILIGEQSRQVQPAALISPEPVVKQDASGAASLLDTSMMDLFRAEVDAQSQILSDGLLALEQNPAATNRIDAMMRAAHSIKGAAKLVNVNAVVELAHVIEDVFVAAQKLEVTLSADNIDVLLRGMDLMLKISHFDNQAISHIDSETQDTSIRICQEIQQILSNKQSSAVSNDGLSHAGSSPPTAKLVSKETKLNTTIPQSTVKPTEQVISDKDRVLRITADRWDRMMGLAGEMKVEAGWLHPYVDSLTQLKKRQVELVQLIDGLRDISENTSSRERLKDQIIAVQRKALDCRQLLSDKLSDLDMYERRLNNLSARMHRETIATRMRPFSDGIQGFQRMVRDIARSLGKKVRLDITGLATQVDRDVLEKMEAPLNHIMRNALDHGVEIPSERIAAGKSEQAIITLSASHSEGMLSITVEDDGRGIDTERLRMKIIEKGLVVPDMAARLSEEELLEFLFLPSFSTRDEVTDLSGRGVGLDVVLDTIHAMRGSVRVTTQFGKGSRFHMQLPLTLSVMSALLVRIAGEPYAFPLARIVRAVKVPVKDVQVLEDHQYATIDGENIGLVGAAEVFEMGGQAAYEDELPVVVISDKQCTYGVVVDRFIGQRELAIQALDSRLGKLQDISSSALLEDGTPVLMIDIDDMVRTIDNLVKGGRVGKVSRNHEELVLNKRILVIDDSLTVREVERQLLENAGYLVDMAVDGMEGWNAVRTQEYDLVVTDIDMPRMDGIELVKVIKVDRRYSKLPVIIMSYKDRAEDRKRGMEAGADYYLTKGSFHDNTLLQAVHDLIGGSGG